MVGEKSLTGRSSLFLRREVWKVLTTFSQRSMSHFNRHSRLDKCGAIIRSIDRLQACFCMGRYLCLDPYLPVAKRFHALWRCTCKPYAPFFSTVIHFYFGADLISVISVQACFTLKWNLYLNFEHISNVGLQACTCKLYRTTGCGSASPTHCQPPGARASFFFFFSSFSANFRFPQNCTPPKWKWITVCVAPGNQAFVKFISVLKYCKSHKSRCTNPKDSHLYIKTKCHFFLNTSPTGRCGLNVKLCQMPLHACHIVCLFGLSIVSVYRG